jgi:hypothetical protein
VLTRARRLIETNGMGNILDKRADHHAKREGGAESGKMNTTKTSSRPGWANGLKQIYDSVVDEPLPDSFKDLLSKLDRGA